MAENSRSVDDYVSSLDERTAVDSATLADMMRQITGQEPTLGMSAPSASAPTTTSTTAAARETATPSASIRGRAS